MQFNKYTQRRKHTVARTGTGKGTITGLGARIKAVTGTRIEMKVERRESLGTYEVVIEAIQKTREGGRRQ